MNFKNDFPTRGHRSDPTTREINSQTPSLALRTTKGTEYSLRVAEDEQGLEPPNCQNQDFLGRTLIVSITKQHKGLHGFKVEAVRPRLATANAGSVTSLGRPAPRAPPCLSGSLSSYPQSSSTSRACRSASAVSLGVTTRRLSSRPHSADRRGGVTRTARLGRGAGRYEPRGSRGDAASGCPGTEDKQRSVTVLCTCSYERQSRGLRIGGEFPNVPERGRGRPVLGPPRGWMSPGPLCACVRVCMCTRACVFVCLGCQSQGQDKSQSVVLRPEHSDSEEQSDGPQSFFLKLWGPEVFQNAKYF